MPTDRAIRKNAVQQQSRQIITNSTIEQQPTVDAAKSNQFAKGLDIQTLLLALFTIILLVGIIYKYTSTAIPPKLAPLPPETSSWDLSEVPEYINTYVTDVFGY